MITIFTPIYNRAYIVKNLYRSLLRQTSHEFEWLIVDDGSTDDVFLHVRQWMDNTHEFKIRYYFQKNQGKHYAINYGVNLAQYKIFMVVDSDDYLEDDAVETIIKYWDGINTNYQFAGIAGLRRSSSEEIIGGLPDFSEFVDATNLEREDLGLTGDKAEVFKTEVLRKFPFPEFANEKFVTEAVVWDRLAYEGYKLRWINKSFMICDYLADGLTAKGEQLFRDNPRGWAHFLKGETIYRKVARREYLKRYYYFYECEHMRFLDDEIKEMLDLDDIDLNEIVTEYNRFMQRLSDICVHKRICIYAYGQWGKRLKNYLNELKIDVNYVIDKRCEEIKEVKAYSIEMELPEIELVFIALSEGADEVGEAMQNKMPDAEVILCRDIIPAMW